jgi:hypothetical protein
MFLLIERRGFPVFFLLFLAGMLVVWAKMLIIKSLVYILRLVTYWKENFWNTEFKSFLQHHVGLSHQMPP